MATIITQEQALGDSSSSLQSQVDEQIKARHGIHKLFMAQKEKLEKQKKIMNPEPMLRRSQSQSNERLTNQAVLKAQHHIMFQASEVSKSSSVGKLQEVKAKKDEELDQLASQALSLLNDIASEKPIDNKNDIDQDAKADQLA